MLDFGEFEMLQPDDFGDFDMLDFGEFEMLQPVDIESVTSTYVLYYSISNSLRQLLTVTTGTQAK